MRAVRIATSARASRLLLLVAIMASGCDWPLRPTHHRGVPIVVGDTMLRYPDSSTFTPGLRDLTFIGQLPARTAAPFVIVAGHECRDCDALPSVLVRAPAEGTVTAFEGLQGWHPYPGRMIDDADGFTRSYSRLFWGECLPQRPPGVVSYRTEFAIPGDEPLRELRITEVQGDSLVEWRSVPEVRVLALTLLQVRAHQCTEVPPREMTSPP